MIQKKPTAKVFIDGANIFYTDFVHLIKILQKQFQKQIVVYSSRRTISWELKLSTNKYFFLEDIRDKIKR